MNRTTLTMAVSTHWSEVIRPLFAQAFDTYNDEQNIPQTLQQSEMPDILTNDLQSVGVTDFVNDPSVNNTDANYLDNLREWAKDNYDFDYLYNLIDYQYQRYGLRDKASEMLLERILDDPTYGQLNDQAYWSSQINMAALPDILQALQNDELQPWVERYANNWREQTEDADQDK